MGVHVNMLHTKRIRMFFFVCATYPHPFLGENNDQQVVITLDQCQDHHHYLIYLELIDFDFHTSFHFSHTPTL